MMREMPPMKCDISNFPSNAFRREQPPTFKDGIVGALLGHVSRVQGKPLAKFGQQLLDEASFGVITGVSDASPHCVSSFEQL